MSGTCDNWERLVAAALKKQDRWELFHADSSSPSLRSEAPSSSNSFNFSSRLDYQDLDFSTSSKFVAKLVLVSDFSPAFDVQDVYVVSKELLVGGIFGCVYSATMDNGARIVMKRLISTTVSEQDFKRTMEIVGDVKHENVVHLRAYYSSQDQRIMLYDYYKNGSVFSLLHGQTNENRDYVDWRTRLKIAIGAARGIAEIHTQLGGMLIHGNIKASNVFLNQQSYGCVSDLGLTSMINTKFSPTARCYAPEVKNTRNVTHASDVYSFGILLLELLTRKSSVHVPGGPAAVDLVKLVNSVKSKDRAAKVFDADLLKYPSIRDELVKMMQIGMQCVEKSIKRRPKMSEVVKMLEGIYPLNPTSQIPLTNKLVFVEDANPTFDLEDIFPLIENLVFVDSYPRFDNEDMFRASVEVLGKGTFGNSYLARRYLIVAKRLKNVNITYKDFQLLTEILGRMRHKNVVGLIAYYFSEYEKIFVYDYYGQGSLSALLHDGPPLDWRVRFEIAVSAARGINHIHMQEGRNFVHGNIKSSNIFINGQNNAVVSDTGLEKLIDPMQLPNVLSRAYQAPEIKTRRKVSQASDVYSFGVVLLELVSGRPSQHTTDENKEAMEQVLQIAMDCIRRVPEDRPNMPQVVKALKEISGSNSFVSKFEYQLEHLLPS